MAELDSMRSVFPTTLMLADETQMLRDSDGFYYFLTDQVVRSRKQPS